MKKLVILVFIMAALSCKKEEQNFQTATLAPGSIVKIPVSIVNVAGPYRVDSISRISMVADASNWYYLTSDNGVDLEVQGAEISPCSNCTFTWDGPSKYFPGNPLTLRTKGN